MTRLVLILFNFFFILIEFAPDRLFLLLFFMKNSSKNLWGNSTAFHLLAYQEGFLWVGRKAVCELPQQAEWNYETDRLICLM